MTKKLSAIKGLLFDKDGTLFDFEKTWNSWTSRILFEVAEQSDVNIDKSSDNQNQIYEANIQFSRVMKSRDTRAPDEGPNICA